MGLYEGSKGTKNVAKSGKVGAVPGDQGENAQTMEGEFHARAAGHHDAKAAHHDALSAAHDRMAEHHRGEAEYHRGKGGK